MRSIKPELESLKKIKLNLNNVWDLPGFTAESCPPSRRQNSPGKISGAGQSYKTSGNLHPRKANKEGTKAILTCRAIKTWAFITEQVTQFKYQVETETLTHAPRPGCGAGSRWCPGRAAQLVSWRKDESALPNSEKTSVEMRRYPPKHETEWKLAFWLFDFP